ncbi:MAG: lipoyl synthase, partial [Candidatus Omnitrophica bacterium]|nr:lipoyl synthase [Candidatus Omnitrophota bacterium]
SGFMVGLGETREEVIELIHTLKNNGCDYLVIGQYLKPSKDAMPVKEFISEELFREYEGIGRSIGFKNIFAGTFYRSSYLAEQLV